MARKFVPGFPVHSSMSPKGVEHTGKDIKTQEEAEVHSSMSPKGVEHRGVDDPVRCV